MRRRASYDPLVKAGRARAHICPRFRWTLLRWKRGNGMLYRPRHAVSRHGRERTPSFGSRQVRVPSVSCEPGTASPPAGLDVLSRW